MRKLFMVVSIFLLLSGTVVYADEFARSSPYDFYAGGYYTSSRSHWTQYEVNGNVTVGAGIKIQNNATEVNNGISKSFVRSKHDVGPYVSHNHYKYTY